MWKCALLKKQENPLQKNCKLVFSGTVEKNCSRQNSMPKTFHTLFKY